MHKLLVVVLLLEVLAQHQVMVTVVAQEITMLVVAVVVQVQLVAQTQVLLVAQVVAE
jgi:hypothetical protein